MTGGTVTRLDGDGNPVGDRVEVIGFELTRVEGPGPDWDATVVAAQNLTRRFEVAGEMTFRGLQAWRDLFGLLTGYPPRQKSPLLAAHRRRRHYG